MSKAATDLSSLSPKQRAILELRLKQLREAATQGREKSGPENQFSASRDDENLVLAQSVERVDELLAKFYGRFPWPWQPVKFDYLEDASFELDMLNQDMGDWRHQSIPGSPAVWVAGCGTNQAINTALRFPTARVLGTDVSAKSLEICANNAAAIGLSNLEVKEESINYAAYDSEFDYIACTGVIHHNADPKVSLEKLARSLNPDGVLEIMVYNRYHRTVTSAFQKAVRIFGEEKEKIDFDFDYAVARKLADNVPVKQLLEHGFIQYMDHSESDFADLLIQPVEHSYTVESLVALAESCGLEILYPCLSLYARSLASTFSWNLEFEDNELQELYDSLPDARRWQVANLILHEKSPLLWFYFRRKREGRPRKSEREVCEEFLDTRFEKAATIQRSFMRGEDGSYRLTQTSLPYPLSAPDPAVKNVYDAMVQGLTCREALIALGLKQEFRVMNLCRTKLTTSAFPHLRAIL